MGQSLETGLLACCHPLRGIDREQRIFKERAVVFEPEIKEHLLTRPWSGDLALLARWTPDPEALANWLLAHRAWFNSDKLLAALGQLGTAGLPTLLERALGGEHRAVREVWPAATRLGAEAVPALFDFLAREEIEAKLLALHLLVHAAPREGLDAFVECLDAADTAVRIEAAKGIAAAIRAGTDATPYRPRVEGLLWDDAPLIRDAAWQALRAAGPVPTGLGARAEDALDDPDPHVRVAAAEVVLASGGNTARATRTLCGILQVPAPHWGWIGGGGTAARTEDGYSDTERLWVRAARALATLGGGAAPAAETIVWAAIRHGEPLMQRILLEAVLAMGQAAEPALPLLDRLASTRSDWLDFCETVHELRDLLKEIYGPFGRRVPAVEDDILLEFVELEDD